MDERARLPDNRRDHVTSLERGLQIMEILGRHPGGLTLTETADLAGTTRAAARRFLLTLVATGYATQAGRRFALSARLLSVARTYLDGASLWIHAEPVMRAVAAEVNESCSAAVLDRQDVVYVARIPGKRIMRISLGVGTRLPAYCTSMGRVLLADLAPDELDAFLARADIVANTPKTITDRARLREEIGRVSADGHAVVDEELEIGLRTVAVPIRDREGRVAAALNVSAQSARFSCEDLRREVLPLLDRAASDIGNWFLDR